MSTPTRDDRQRYDIIAWFPCCRHSRKFLLDKEGSCEWFRSMVEQSIGFIFAVVRKVMSLFSDSVQSLFFWGFGYYITIADDTWVGLGRTQLRGSWLCKLLWSWCDEKTMILQAKNLFHFGQVSELRSLSPSKRIKGLARWRPPQFHDSHYSLPSGPLSLWATIHPAS